MKSGIGFQPMGNRQDADTTTGFLRRFLHADSLRRPDKKGNRGLRGSLVLVIVVVLVNRKYPDRGREEDR
jgi:hypothetical protein